MTNHWNNELEIIALGRKAASPYMGEDAVKLIVSVADALRSIEMCIEERGQLMDILHDATRNGEIIEGWNPSIALDEEPHPDHCLGDCCVTEANMEERIHANDNR